MHEIVTLQFGNFANYIGTHFWNTQESYFTYSETEEPNEIDHNVHFRAGSGLGGADTFTPRVLIYDLKGGFGSMRKINQLYEDVDNAENNGRDALSLWDYKSEIRRTTTVEKNQFQKSLDEGDEPAKIKDETVRYWSDFNRVFYHPRSSVQLNQFEFANPLTPFEAYDAGRELFSDIDREHEILDRDFRHFAEDCDLLQGIQILTTVDDAWGGFTAEYIGNLRDDYPKANILTWAVERGDKVARDKQLLRTTAALSSLSTIALLSSTYVPLYFPKNPLRLPRGIKLGEKDSIWRVTAVLAAAIETCTLPTRSKMYSGRLGHLGDVCAMLNTTGRQNISQLAFNAFEAEGDEADSNAAHLSWSAKHEHVFADAEVMRGLKTDPKKEEKKEPRTSNDKIMERYFTDLPYSILDSTPDIFGSTDRTSKIALKSNLTTTSAICERLKYSQTMVRRLVEVDERETLENTFAEMQEAYQEGWDSGSDMNDD